MCDVCRNEGLDRFFKNGPKRTDTFRQRLYNFFHDKEAVISLCHIHTYELFLIGEKRFAQRHPLLVRDMIQEKKKYMTSSTSSF